MPLPSLDPAARKWLAAREIIADFLLEESHAPRFRSAAEDAAAAIIARLAQRGILLAHADEIKEG